MDTTTKALLVFFILACSAIASGQTTAQNYPTRPIRLIVPFPPGGPLDIVARLMVPNFTAAFKQSIVVDNRPGGGGTIGTETAVRATPDGYTMILVSAAYATNAALYKLTYDPLNEVTPIGIVGNTGFIVTLHPSVSIASIKDLIAYDKANPGKLNYGSGGTGGSNHLVAELFNQMAGTKMTHVPYKGIGPALNELLGGQIHLVVASIPPTVPLIKSNRLRGIAVTTAARANAMPDIPTVGESIPSFEAVNWVAMLAPKALPKEIVERWNREINHILQFPEVKERMAVDGLDPVGGTPERFREVLTRDVAKWQKVVKLANIKLGG